MFGKGNLVTCLEYDFGIMFGNGNLVSLLEWELGDILGNENSVIFWNGNLINF